MTLRQAKAEDLDALVSFNQAMAQETEGKRLDPTTLRQGVNGLLTHPEYGFYLVAEQEGEIRGSLAVTFEWSDWRNALFWWIQSVYVSPSARRQGIYAGLYNRVQLLAKEQGNVCGFRLYVEKDNEVAQQTYKNLGMQECQYYMYQSKD
ncbi:GNAT family N-acetyltransferase [Lacimicrobium alkaliphilum]|uniref:GNAT family N-acetyltransferase n=1 Tax=Lacimicrobium alkaliphilum TaxID=1526571 RepID=UPI000BFEC00E|nr:GNAT family N-acetyltransferase [Lacimicrobium alkaliphilum]